MEGNSNGVVLLIGSGQRAYREYLLKGLAGQTPLWLIDEDAASWQSPYVVGSSAVGMLDEERMVYDRPGLVAAALQVARDRKVSGVITYDELLVPTAAEIAEQLGVRGLTVTGAENCRDKFLTRTALTAAGLPQPRFALAHKFEEAEAAAADIGYPVVLKPRGMGMSVGVVRVEGPAELAAAFAMNERARRAGPPAYESGVLVEEMMDGPEISIDAAVTGGDCIPFCIGRKQLGEAPYFEEVGHLVDSADPLLTDPDLRKLLADAHNALGAADGMTHTEVRFTPRGPVIIEVNARLGGDLIPYLGLLATGVDPGRVAAEIALGTTPSVEPSLHLCAGIRFLYPPADCEVVEIRLPEPGAIPGLVDAHPMARPGATLRLPPRAHLGRHAFVMATAPTPTACAAVLDEAAALVELSYKPIEQPELYHGRPW